MTELKRRQFLKYTATFPLALFLPPALATTRLRGKIHELEGEVFINRNRADINSVIYAGDRLSVAYGGRLVFAMGEDTYLLQEGSSLELVSRDNIIISGLRLLTGGLLSAFGDRNKKTTIYTRTATIGIRGTGVYLNSQPENLYFCTCYGKTELRTGHRHEFVEATHHSAYNITGKSSHSMSMTATEVIGHTDDELRLLERYAGRKPAFDTSL